MSSRLVKVNVRVPAEVWKDIGDLCRATGLKRGPAVTLALRRALPGLKEMATALLEG
jgi:hypothetical protein